MSLRWQFTRDTRFVVPIKVEIYDSEYGGGVQTLPIVGDQPVIEQFGTRNADGLELIKGSFAEFRLRGEAGDFDDLFSRNNERFLIKLFVDGSLWSEYIPVPDTFSEPVTGGNYEIIIKGANLSLLKQVDVLDILTAGERISKLDGIYSIISHFFSMPVVDGTILYPTGADQSTSALSQIFFNVDRFDENASAYDALQWLVSKGNQIRIARGKVFVLPVLESEFTGYEYSGSTVGSGVLYNQNFASEKIGGRLATERTGLVTYSGVERVYNPGEIENIVSGGDMEADDFVLNNQTFGESGNPARILRDWTYFGGVNAPISVRTDRNEWKIGIPDRIAEYGFFTPFEGDPVSVIAGQRLQFKLRGRYDNVRDKDTIFILRVVVRVGDLYLSDLQGQGGILNWVSSPSTIRIPLTEAGQSDYQILTTPLPTSGEVEFRIIINQDNSSAVGNFIYLSEIKSLIADENGDVITELDTLAGERGQVYDYNEQFGDGFTSISPGALFFDGEPTETWNIIGIPDGAVADLPLSDIQVKYLASELTRDRERISGTVDTYDTIALIDGKRVNYSRTDWRYGQSQIELVEIEEHDLTATVEDRKIKDPNEGISVVGDPFFFPEDRFPFSQTDAIGFITRDYENETTETLEAQLDVYLRTGVEYWVINESQLSRSDRFAGVYSVIPKGIGGEPVSWMSGTIPIQEQIINAPSGSLIFKAPGQDEADDEYYEEKDREFEEKFVQLDIQLDLLDDALDDLDAELENLNDVVLPALQNNLDNLNNTVIPALNNELDTLDGYFNDPSTIPVGYSFFTGIVASDVFTQTLVAKNAFVAELAALNLFADTIIANTTFTDTLAANTVFTDAVIANDAFIAELVARNAFIEQLTARELFVDELVGNTAFIDSLMTQTLILTSTGQITNTSGDYLIDPSGIRVNVTGSDSLNTSRAFRVRNIAGGADLGAMWGFSGIFSIDAATGTGTTRIRGQSSLSLGNVLSTGDVNIGSTTVNALVRDFKAETSRDVELDAHRYVRLIFDDENANVRFNSATNSGTDGRPEAGRIELNVNGQTRIIKLYGT